MLDVDHSHRRAPPEEVGARIPGDTEEPRLEAAVVPVGVAVLENPHEHVLDEILGGRPIARGAAQKVEQRRVVALEQTAQLSTIAGPDGPHQKFVSHKWL